MTKYKYISNAPCGQDLFAGKAHEHTASKIAELLLNSERSLMVGLDGGWGTGKSNLISQVQNKMLKEKQVLFFTYDAWGHQDDLTRRSILEELTDCVCTPCRHIGDNEEPKVLSQYQRKKWKVKLKDLLSKKRETTTRNIPKVSIGILLVSLILLLTPVFNTIGEAFPTHYSKWCKLIITALPLLFGVLSALILYLKMEKRDFKSFLEEFISIYKEKTKENTTYEEEFSSEPSSKQFKKWMHDLDADLLCPLVIVFDNMDRLPTHKVQDFWAAIHSFFSEVSYKNIQVIVPFDRDHIISAFRTEDITAENSNDKTSRCYGNDFIDKTFHVVYRVAPPTLSNWKTYLEELWEFAFGYKLKADSSITQIYDLLTDSKTPREIIAFINECVSIREICDSKIPDEYIVLFVVGKLKIAKAPQKELLQLDFCKSMAYKYHNVETSKFLSALYYQLPAEEALDLIYSDQLRRQLENGNNDLLSTLVTKDKLSFILENAITGLSNVKNITEAFMQTEAETAIPTRFWDQLILKQNNSDDNSPEEFQINLLKHSSISLAKHHLQKVIEQVYKDCASYTNAKGDIIQSLDATKFYQTIGELNNDLNDCGDLSPYDYLHNEETNPAKYIEFVETAREHYEEIKVSCSETDLDKYLSELSILELGKITCLPLLHIALPTYIDGLKKEFSETTDSKEAEILLDRLVEKDIFISSLPSDDYIRTFFTNAQTGTKFYYFLICIRIARGGNFAYSDFNSVLSSVDEELAIHLAAYIDLFVNFGGLLKMYNTMGTKPLYTQIVRYLIQNHGCKRSRKMTVNECLPLYNEVVETFNVSLEEFLSDIDLWSNYFDSSITIKNITSLPIDFFVKTSQLTNYKVVKHCINVAYEYLKIISIEDWKKGVIEENNDYKILLVLKKDVPNAYEAYKLTIQAELDELCLKLSDKTYSDLTNLFQTLNKHWKSVFQKARDRFADSGKDITKELFLRYGSEMIEKGDLTKKPDSIQTLLPTSFLKDSDTLQILSKHASRVNEIVNTPSNEYSKEFKEEIKSVYKSAPSSEIQDLMKSFGITLASQDVSREGHS
ncbi:P-loop NTPase fold protein [Hoylesella nanceiensis]|uniref:P-loop NTPase fold protein n=1 Tax=Hoylesella nanceiensis TaxID=425941 RepID=UPI0028EE9CAE|nr:P-loop NTPase fold protein [Hoylesella nanceiensis]